MAEAAICTTSWSLTNTATENTGTGSCATGYTFAVEGRKDTTATVNFIWDVGAALPAEPGDSDLLKLYTDDTHYWSFDAICERFDFEIDVSEGGLIRGTYQFALNYSSNAPAFTGTGNGPLGAVNAKVGWGT